MKDAVKPTQEALDSIKFNKPKVPIITNISANVTTDPIKIKEDLLEQVTGRVRWRETLKKLIELDVKEIIEIGSGNVLTKMLAKSGYEFSFYNISTVKDMENFLEKNS